MKRVFSWAATLCVPAAVGGLGLIACDPPIEPTETVSNGLVDTSSTVPVPVDIQSIELRFLGEQDEDITSLPSADSFETTLGAVMGPTLSGACTDDVDCGEGASCAGGVCATPTQVSVSAVECGTYEARITGANGGTCEFTIPRPDGTTCTTRTDCPDGLDCVEGACDFREYRGNGLYICFVGGVWGLGAHISDGNCAAIYPNASSGS